MCEAAGMSGHTHIHTYIHTHRTTTVTLAAHARRGLMKMIWHQCVKPQVQLILIVHLRYAQKTSRFQSVQQSDPFYSIVHYLFKMVQDLCLFLLISVRSLFAFPACFESIFLFISVFAISFCAWKFIIIIVY